MADYEANIAPFINKQFTVTTIFGHYSDGREHNGLDLSTTAGTGRGSELYSMVTGHVLLKGWDPNGYGNYIVTVDDNSHQAFLYGHMFEPSPLEINDPVYFGTFVGWEGSTGNSTGTHVHVLQEDLTYHDWQWGLSLSQYENPANYIGIPNQVGITGIYYGTPEPPTPPEPPTTKGTNKWFMRKNRKVIIKL